MPRYEFRCTSCERTEDVHASFDEPVPGEHDCRALVDVPLDSGPVLRVLCKGTMRRVFGVPAIGRGSSGGTPSRGHQRFVKGDAGWTNG